MVPSLTELLIEVGINIVGRTKYCIHPKKLVQEIPTVGGTKNLNIKQFQLLKPDLIIVEKEENPKNFIEKLKEFKIHITHIKNIKDLIFEIQRLDELFMLNNITTKLSIIKKRWEKVLKFKLLNNSISKLPTIEWLKEPSGLETKILYVIWKKPWMTVSKRTFISDVLMTLGFESFLFDFDTAYPIIDMKNYDPTELVLLFSSEPYNFLNIKNELLQMPFSSAIVDGESYSWFGIRSLRFLEIYLSIDVNLD